MAANARGPDAQRATTGGQPMAHATGTALLVSGRGRNEAEGGEEDDERRAAGKQRTIYAWHDSEPA